MIVSPCVMCQRVDNAYQCSYLTSEPQPWCLDYNQTDKNDSNGITVKGRIRFLSFIIM